MRGAVVTSTRPALAEVVVPPALLLVVVMVVVRPEDEAMVEVSKSEVGCPAAVVMDVELAMEVSSC